MFIRTFFLVSALFSTFSVAAVYKWVDAEGRTQYGDRPPAQVSRKQVQLEAAPVKPDVKARERQQSIKGFLNQKQQEREVQQAASAKAEKQAAKQEKQCRKLRARLKHMESISTFYNLNDDGERIYVSESENSQIRQRFREKVRKVCSS